MEVTSDSELCLEVCSRGDYFLKSELLFDCKFLVGAEPDQVVFSSHKLILAMASPVFEAMFCGSMPECNDFIPVVDIQPKTFKLLLKYIYSGSINTISIDEVCNLCYAAKKYMMEHLVTKCVKHLYNHVTIKNVVQLHRFARLFNETCLLTKCEHIICWKTKDVLKESNFKDVDLNMAVEIFSMNSLNIDSELDLIEAAARYAKVNLESHPAPAVDTQEVNDPVTSGSSDSEVATNNISQIRRLVEKIRFLTLTPQQFAECHSRTAIMTTSEQNAVLWNLVSKKSNTPMPAGFTTSRAGRHRVSEIGSSNRYDDARSEATFCFEIQDVENIATIVDSPSCYVGNVPWNISVERNSDNTHLGIYIECEPGENALNWTCKPEVQIWLMSHRITPIHKKFELMFKKPPYNWGYGEFVKWTELLDPTKGYINNGAITVKALIKFTENPQSFTWPACASTWKERKIRRPIRRINI